jgi:hypothetical protein
MAFQLFSPSVNAEMLLATGIEGNVALNSPCAATTDFTLRRQPGSRILWS